jgi:NRPS condensation-like uncharacterized protein
VTLPAELVRRLDLRRLPVGATINDILLASLHRAVADWNAGRGRPAESIAVLMPVNLRPPEWRHEVVGNLTLGGTVVTTPSQRSSDDSLLAAVVARTRSIKAGDDFAAFLAKPRWVRNVVAWVLLARGVGHQSTAVLSNLGRLDDPPDFGPRAGAVTEVWFSPPVGMPTGLGVGVAGMSGRLHLSLRYCRTLFDADAAQRFSAFLLNDLTSLAEGAGEGSPEGAGPHGRPAGMAVAVQPLPIGEWGNL